MQRKNAGTTIFFRSINQTTLFLHSGRIAIVDLRTMCKPGMFHPLIVNTACLLTSTALWM